MKKVLVGLVLVLILLFVSAATAAARTPRASALRPALLASTSPSVLLSDSFENGVKWNSNSSNWTISSAQCFSGTHAAYTTPLPPNQLIYGPFDLSSATAATLSFQLYYYPPKLSSPPGSTTTCGNFCVGYSTDGSIFTYPFQWHGDTGGGWFTENFDLAVAGWSLVGQPKVWIAFSSTAWNSVFTPSEAFIDELTLTATIPDTTPPTTTLGGAVSGHWYHVPVTLTFTATDNPGGSGMSGGLATTEYSLDAGSTWTPATSLLLPAPANHSGDKRYTILYRSVDAAGNPETAKTFTCGIDTRKPTTKAPYAATAYRGRTATLRYRVNDPVPNGGTATVTIKVRNAAGSTVKTLGPAVRKVNSLLSWSFTVPRTWRAGTYHFYVSAKDKAGNTQTLPLGSNKLVVK